MIVTLICVKEGSKLRVKILSEGYIQHANCQFPKSIREEGATYLVDSKFINLHTSRGRYFYSVKKKEEITVVFNKSKSITIYENTEESDCAVCFSCSKDTVFVPCGHYYCCLNCASRLNNCPICRCIVTNYVNRSLVD